ncbi:MAG: rod shape-determining protein RodA, partial [Calditrichales bacterium]
MIQRYDYISLGLILLLVAIGCVAIYSATLSGGSETNSYFSRQVIWAVFGTIVMISVSLLSIKLLNRFAYWVYGASLFLLLLVLVVGKVGQGAERWLALGPLHIQPAEIAKL